MAQARRPIDPTQTLMQRKKRKSGLAVSTAVAGSAATVANAQIEEIIVTATRRAEGAQDVPVAVQAVDDDTLRELRVDTFDRYVEYLPNVVSAGDGPGKKELYIRGGATEQASVTVAPAQGSAPGVALYVDEQPVSFGARNLDVYAVDLERIEVREGRQGWRARRANATSSSDGERVQNHNCIPSRSWRPWARDGDTKRIVSANARKR